MERLRNNAEHLTLQKQHAKLLSRTAQGSTKLHKLRIDKGRITREDREFLERETPDILKSVDNNRRKFGNAARVLATQFYQKSTRFIYELIQNAEENRYTIAAEPPCLSFTLQPDQVIIDSNEDGFTRKDIKSICSIGESTKTDIQGYIGKKASSGPYSFAFEYLKGDRVNSGPSMVTPINESRQELPGGVRTRTVLYLYKDKDREALYQDLLTLPNTLLLFLKNLQQLTVKFEVPDKDIQKVQFYLSSNNKGRFHNIVEIKTAVTGMKSSITPKSFWVKKHRAVNLPVDSARRDIYEAEVVLAFPIDEHDVPVIENQDVFAFLPLRKVGYKFLLQSDFIIKDNRENVVDSAWNKRLLEEVVTTFRSAIDGPNGFLEHDTLRYSWVRYIPTDSIADDFWGFLGSFAFVDPKEYSGIFKNKINLLDFSLEEVHTINLILVGLGLYERYKETKIGAGLLDDALTKDLRRKAYAICRYAAHHGSNNVIPTYRLLQTLKVFTSDSIAKEVSITHNKIIISINVLAASLHTAQDDDGLKLYVPKEQRQRDVCLSRQLPIELIKHLGIPKLPNGAELGSILTATRFFTVDAILDSDGIIEVPGISPPEDHSESELSTPDDSANIVSPTIDAESESITASPETASKTGGARSDIEPPSMTNTKICLTGHRRPEFERSPTYYIEVKTTLGPLDTPFYCSQNQFDIMENLKLQDNQSLSEVYLIARVFKLGARGMGFKLYLDPADLRRKGQLKFTSDKYIITT
ncbi:hypothetical protein SBOR_0766 [Sclerotinia borealis F-4128]|uniref:Protein NO VEIN C-terminal domain-containing protein n=1 Tax=Sclerotinia borealis (strain F-4128) TaxID=1432307 RepID=W9CS30_SCLBF|nr:hypothetical protein SBOR_0766 [Sclerotinia borealis F-4128]